MKFTESMGEWHNRIKENGPRKPMRTMTEMAEEFGLTARQLQSFIIHRDGPKPLGGKLGLTSWYRPSVLREWWAKQQAKPEQ